MHDAFAPAKLGGIELRNRFIKTATYEGMCPGGVPSDRLIAHHRELARGGVGMTTVAYCAVSPDGRTFSQQMHMHPGVVPRLRELTDAVHAEGAAASIQLGHCGMFSKNKELTVPRPLGPSFSLNAYGVMSGMPFGGAMTEADLDNVVADFARAAQLAQEAGFDAVEIHLGHGYLLSQFLSPAVNRRRDRWGGTTANRLRLPLSVVRAVRDALGPDFPILTKNNLRDGFSGGLELEEALEIARALEGEGVNAMVTSGGFTSRNAFYLMRGTRPLKQMIEVEKSGLQRVTLRLLGRWVVREYPFQEAFFLDDARRLRRAVEMPLALLGGMVSRDNVQRAMSEGFDFVVMGRALIHDPHFINKLQREEVDRSACDHCNQCVAEMDREGVHCVREEAPGFAFPETARP